MPRKSKKNEEITHDEAPVNAVIIGAGEVVDQPITETLETNYMPYAMSVIMSRAIPEIDGFKPSFILCIKWGFSTARARSRQTSSVKQ